MKKVILISLCVFSTFHLGANEEMESMKDEALEFTQMMSKEDFDKARFELERHDQGKGLFPETDIGKSFSSQEIRRQLEEGGPHDVCSEEYDFLTCEEVKANARDNSFDINEGFMREADQILEHRLEVIDGSLVEEESESGAAEEIVTCQSPGAEYPLTMTKSLRVEVNNVPELKVRVCKGHEFSSKRHRRRKNAEDNERQVRAEYQADSELKSWGSKIDGHYYVYHNKIHKDNARSCDNWEEKIVQKGEKSQKPETWETDDPEMEKLIARSNCQKIEVLCTEGKKRKSINGLSVEKPCWKEKHTFLCKSPQKDQCAALASRFCTLLPSKTRCLERAPDGHCILEEKQFSCTRKFTNSLKKRSEISGDSKIYGLFGMEFEQPNDANQDLAETISTLSIFQEMDEQVRGSSKGIDEITLFGGEVQKCKKSVFNNALYDCCTTLKGMAMGAGLREKCSAEEMKLGERREKGLCHLVGNYKEKVMGMTKAHVTSFCCFPTKLSRVLQEQGRKQLINRDKDGKVILEKMPWGSAEKPSCGGFTYEDFAELRLEDVDLTEVFEEKIRELSDIQGKIDSFQARLEDAQSNMERAKNEGKRGPRDEEDKEEG